MNGIDISKYQKQIDWSKVSGIEFALVRIGMGNDEKQVDPCYRRNVDQALSHGFYVGGYYFSYATSIADAQKEADVCNALLQPYKGKLLFPIGYDYEYASADYFAKVKGRAPTNVEIDSFACAFCDRMKSYGWFVNVYTNIDYYRSGKFKTAIKKYDVWLADYNGSPDYPCYIQQTGSTGKIPGISGNVDTNISFRDYPTMIKAKGYNGYPKPKDTSVWIDTTINVYFPKGNNYIFATESDATPKVTVGTAGVVNLSHVNRVENKDYWKLTFIGNPGQSCGIYTAASGEQPTKRFIAYVD